MLVTSLRCWWPIEYIENIPNHQITKKVANTAILPTTSQISHQHNDVINSTVTRLGKFLWKFIVQKLFYLWHNFWNFPVYLWINFIEMRKCVSKFLAPWRAEVNNELREHLGRFQFFTAIWFADFENTITLVNMFI